MSRYVIDKEGKPYLLSNEEIGNIKEDDRMRTTSIFDEEKTLSHDEMKEELSLEDNVNQPSHYLKYKLEMIDNLRNSMTREEYKGFLKGNIIKYISRYQDKNGIEDINKAEWYIIKLKEEEESYE